eukprot:jgi/Botrbrau1/20684/Bobra.0058s0014.1
MAKCEVGVGKECWEIPAKSCFVNEIEESKLAEMNTTGATQRDRAVGVPADFTRHRRGRWNGWFLGNIIEIHEPEQENILLVFSDPAHEQGYSDYFNRTHLFHDVVGLAVSIGVALMFFSRAEFGTVPAKMLRNCAIVGIALNAMWFFTTLFAPAFALKYRNPAVYILSWFLHAVVACLPPLTYQSYKTPTTAFGAYMLIIMNSRFLQNFFAMGAYSSTGFFADLALLTILEFLFVHWNKEECEFWCALQPGIAARYHDVARVIPSFLMPRGPSLPTAEICLAVRRILQVVMGWTLPIIIGLRSELSSRTSYAKEARLRVRPVEFADLFSQIGIANVCFLATVAAMSSLLIHFPQLEHLPTLLRTGSLAPQH